MLHKVQLHSTKFQLWFIAKYSSHTSNHKSLSKSPIDQSQVVEKKNKSFSKLFSSSFQLKVKIQIVLTGSSAKTRCQRKNIKKLFDMTQIVMKAYVIVVPSLAKGNIRNDVGFRSRHGLVVRTHAPFMGARVHEPNSVQAEGVAQNIEIQGSERVFTQKVVDGDRNDECQDESGWHVDSANNKISMNDPPLTARVVKVSHTCVGIEAMGHLPSHSCRLSCRALWHRDAFCSKANPCGRRRSRESNYVDQRQCR